MKLIFEDISLTDNPVKSHMIGISMESAGRKMLSPGWYMIKDAGQFHLKCRQTGGIKSSMIEQTSRIIAKRIKRSIRYEALPRSLRRSRYAARLNDTIGTKLKTTQDMERKPACAIPATQSVAGITGIKQSSFCHKNFSLRPQKIPKAINDTANTNTGTIDADVP